MFELTENEILLYNKKKRVIKEFIEVFGATHTLNTNIYRGITFKEWMSDDFQNVFYPLLKKETSVFTQNFFRNEMYGNGALTKEYTREEREYILDIFLKDLSSDGFSGYEFENIVKLVDFISKTEIPEEVKLKKLIQYNIFAKVSNGYKDDLYAYVNKTLSKGKFEDAESIISYIQTVLPDYRGLSLIIMNKNVELNERIKCLKKIYKQKDLPAFKTHLRNTMEDLEILDIFIEATIIQNNRVKEKDANLIKLFKDIFISGDSGSRNIYNRINDWKYEFSEKYVHYILDPVFAKKLYSEAVDGMSTNMWQREKNWGEFLNLITCSLSADEVIKAVETVPALNRLGENFPYMFKKVYEENDYDSMDSLLRVFSAWAVNNSPDALWNNISNVVDVDEFLPNYKNKEVFDTFYKDYRLIKYNGGKDYRISAESISSELINRFILDFDNFSKMNIMDDSELPYLGISFDRFSKSRNIKNENYYAKVRVGMAMKLMAAFYEGLTLKGATMNVLLPDIDTNSKSPEESKQTIKNFSSHAIERFFKWFEDDETSKNLMQYVLSVNENRDWKEVEIKGTSYWSNTKKDASELYLTIVKNALNAGSNFYEIMSNFDSSYTERGERFKENMETCINGIELICCFGS